MEKHVFERSIPGVGSLKRDERHAASTRSCITLDVLGRDIQWFHSYLTGDRIYCIPLAENEQLIRERAERAERPAERISAVRAMIDPTMRSTASAAHA